MTWPRYLDLCAYWRKVPPLAEVVAAFMGAGKGNATGEASAPPAPEGSDEAFAALQRDFAMITM